MSVVSMYLVMYLRVLFLSFFTQPFLYVLVSFGIPLCLYFVRVFVLSSVMSLFL